jgi:uncharacterized membrane protein
MAFVDDLALIEVLLLLGAVLFAYGGVMSWWAIRNNDPKALKNTLHGMAVPLGALGVVTTAIALWGEMVWPFPAADNMAGYNIFFFDALILFGLVLLAYSVSAFVGAKMQYVGMFALVAGGVVAFYGYTGYTAAVPFTKDPFDTLLLYTGFGAAGIFAFPATVIMDYYLGATEALKAPFTSVRSVNASGLRRLGVRGAQPVVPGAATPASPSAGASPSPTYHVPYWVQTVLLLFPLFAGLAAIAAFWYFGVTLPGHLGAGAGGAP